MDWFTTFLQIPTPAPPGATPTIGPYTRILFEYVFVTFSYIGTLLTLNFADIILGVFAAAVKGKVSSSASLRGIAKKSAVWVGILVVLILAREAKVPYLVRPIFWWFMWGEFVSINENLARCGVKYPSWVIKAFYVFRDIRGNSEKTNDLLGKLIPAQTPVLKEKETVIVLNGVHPMEQQKEPVEVKVVNDDPVPVVETKKET